MKKEIKHRPFKSQDAAETLVFNTAHLHYSACCKHPNWPMWNFGFFQEEFYFWFNLRTIKCLKHKNNLHGAWKLLKPQHVVNYVGIYNAVLQLHSSGSIRYYSPTINKILELFREILAWQCGWRLKQNTRDSIMKDLLHFTVIFRTLPNNQIHVYQISFWLH